MRRALIVSGAILLVIVVLIGLAILNLNRIIAANRGYALARISDALGRTVEIRDVTVTLRWGVAIDVTGLKIADDPGFSQLPVVEVADLFGEAELIPLIFGKFHLQRLVFRQPEIRIVRDAAGRLNLSELGKKPEPRAGAPDETKPAEAKPPGPLGAERSPAVASGQSSSNGLRQLQELSINAFAIENGAVSYKDLREGGEPLRAAAIDLEVKNFSASGRFDVSGKMAALSDDQDLAFSGEAGPLMREGKLDPGAIPLDLKATVGPILLERLRQTSMVGGAIPRPLAISAAVEAQANLTGNLDSLRFTLSTDLSSPQVIYGGILDKPSGVVLKVSASGSRNQGRLEIAEANLELASLDLKVGNPQFGRGIVQARVDTNRFDLAPLVRVMPAAAKYAVTGSAQIHADLRAQMPYVEIAASPQRKPGPPSMQLKVVAPRLEAHGTVELAKVSIKPPGGAIPALANLNGNVRLTGNGAQIEPTTFDLGSGHAKLQADVASFDPLNGDFHFSDDVLKLSELLPSRKSESPEELRQLTASGTLGGSLSAPQLNASIASPDGSVANVAYRNLALTATYGDKRIDLNSIKLNGFDGTIAGAGAATMAGARPIEATLNLDHIDLEKALASQKAKAASTVRGIMTGQIRISGRGATFDQIKPTLQGGGKAAIHDGKLLGVNVVAQGMKKAHGIPGVGDLVPPEVVARHPELFASPDTDIRDASLTFTVEGPRIISHDIVVQSVNYRILADGSFDMDRNIDLKAKIVLTQPFSKELEAARKNIVYLTNGGGEVEIPVTIAGALPKPSVLPDVQSMIQTAAQHALQKKGGKLLGGLLGGKNKGSGGSNANPLAPLEKFLH